MNAQSVDWKFLVLAEQSKLLAVLDSWHVKLDWMHVDSEDIRSQLPGQVMQC